MKKAYFEHDIENAIRRNITKKIEECEYDNSDPILSICVLRGGFMFFTHVMKSISLDINTHIDFIRTRSYNGKTQEEFIEIMNNINIPEGVKRIYFYDDILDSGNTAKGLAKHVNGAYDLYFVALCKRKGVDHSFLNDYYREIITGIEVEEGEWLTGWGMDDLNGLNRNSRVINII